MYCTSYIIKYVFVLIRFRIESFRCAWFYCPVSQASNNKSVDTCATPQWWRQHGNRSKVPGQREVQTIAALAHSRFIQICILVETVDGMHIGTVDDVHFTLDRRIVISLCVLRMHQLHTVVQPWASATIDESVGASAGRNARNYYTDSMSLRFASSPATTGGCWSVDHITWRAMCGHIVVVAVVVRLFFFINRDVPSGNICKEMLTMKQ